MIESTTSSVPSSACSVASIESAAMRAASRPCSRVRFRPDLAVDDDVTVDRPVPAHVHDIVVDEAPDVVARRRHRWQAARCRARQGRSAIMARQVLRSGAREVGPANCCGDVRNRGRRTMRGVHASESATRVGEDRVLADIDRNLPAVNDYLLHRCGGRGLAEDLTSETVLATVDHVRNGHIDTIEIGYLIGIARHKLVDHWRRQSAASSLQGVRRDEEIADDEVFEPGRAAPRSLTSTRCNGPHSRCGTSTISRYQRSRRYSDARCTRPKPCSSAPSERSARATHSPRTQIMVDPFESLRHDAESTGSTAIDSPVPRRAARRSPTPPSSQHRRTPFGRCHRRHADTDPDGADPHARQATQASHESPRRRLRRPRRSRRRRRARLGRRRRRSAGTGRAQSVRPRRPRPAPKTRTRPSRPR